MPAPYDTIFMVVDRQLYFGEVLTNRYFYGASSTQEPNAPDLADVFQTDVLQGVANAQVDQLTHINLIVVNVSDVTDFANLTISVPGAQDGDGLPPAAPVGFRSAQPGWGLRSAAKRISGIIEGWQSGGVVDTSQLGLTSLAASFGQQLEGDDAAYNPCIVSVPTPFELPLAVVPSNRDALNWTIRPRMSTQATRRQRIT